MKSIINVIFILASVICGTNYSIASNLVINPSFESYSGSFQSSGAGRISVGSGDLTGWSIVNQDTAIIKNSNIFNLTSSDGENFIDLEAWGNTDFPKGISQTLNGLTIGRTYSFAMDLGIRNGSCGSFGDVCHGPVQVTASVGGSSQIFTHSSSNLGNIWGTYGFDFTATDTNMLLTILGESVPAGNHYIGLDNVAVNAVPIPAALWLFGTGLLTILGGIKKRQLSLAA